MNKRKTILDEETISVSSNDDFSHHDANSENETTNNVGTTPRDAHNPKAKKTKISHNDSSTPKKDAAQSSYQERRTSAKLSMITTHSKPSSATKATTMSSPTSFKSTASTPKTPTNHKNVTSKISSSKSSKATPSSSSSSSHHGKSSTSSKEEKTPKSSSSASKTRTTNLIDLSPTSSEEDHENDNENTDNNLTIGEIITPLVVEFSKNKIHTYFPYKFSTIEDFEKVVKCIEEKYNESNIYVKGPDLKVIKDWHDHLKNQKTIIASRVVRKEKARDDNTFNIEQEDKNFKTINRLMNRLRNILINHENHDTTDMSRLTSCIKERTERKKLEQEEERQLQKEHNDLRSKSEAEQKKFFIKREGPIQGLKEYYEWSSTLALGAHLSTMANTHNKQFSVVDKLSPFAPSADNDEDDILNQDIL
ncbi:hypothetical protein FDP41_003990 [Naegleria fowleri]|uniref:Uncharacterized protein n=1 Tax=Naegleria fowleri TaxID=5763 RepID=A0A6A5BTG9_NAEFO|nr:uncharacterized protein FDP41_003990 [Naegleria fowleri]KAF0976695.1 hypothetical protein FDP41_003990 [Naegleria fowleri]CAG4712913.1 unnamed protein product [Naegleria fowleri]